MRALVTGGAGFIGSNLVSRLFDEGWDILVVDNLSSGRYKLLADNGKLGLPPRRPRWGYQVESQSGQVRFRLDTVGALTPHDLKNVDIIFHQAAVPRVSFSVEHPVDTLYDNLGNTVKLFKVAADADVPVVWASSSSVYGGAANLPTHESERGNVLPKSPYAMQKYHAEDYAALFGQLYGLKSIGLRYFNVFGPGQYGDSAYATAVSAWCHAIKHGQQCRSDGDGEQTRDMCYIDNVVQANMKAAAVLLDGCSWSDLGRCYNVACGDRVSNNEILAFLGKRFNERVQVRHAPERPGDVKHTQADISRAQEELGYEVEVRFWAGLEATLAWWDLS